MQVVSPIHHRQSPILGYLAGFIAAGFLTVGIGFADSRADDLKRAGVEALKSDRYNDAITRFSDAIKLAPNDADNWLGRCKAYSYSGDFAPALADCEQAVKLSPQNGESRALRGAVYLRSGNLQAALDDENAALSLDPNNARAYRERGNVYHALKQPAKAMADYDQALRIKPADGTAYALRGNLWFAKGNYDAAWDDYNKAVQVDPREPYPYICRGYAAMRFYDFDNAIADFKVALGLDPSSKAAQKDLQYAEHQKSALFWGKINLYLMAAGVLALLLGAVRAFRSPTALRNTVDSCFRSLPDGRRIFVCRRGAYVVSDVLKEEELRVFARRFHALLFPAVIAAVALWFVAAPLTMPAFEWLERLGLSSGNAYFVFALGEVLVSFLAAFFLLNTWQRAATQGLVRIKYAKDFSRANAFFINLFRDMPSTARWIVITALVFWLIQSIPPCWRAIFGLSLTNLKSRSLFGWALVITPLAGPFFYGWLLLQLVRERPKKAEAPQQ